MSLDESRKLASGMPGVEYLLVQKDGSRVVSTGWRKLATRALAAPPAPYTPQAAGAWNPAFELAISLELAHFDSPVRRPYVAVWIEDKDRFPVRTLALWFQKARWLPRSEETGIATIACGPWRKAAI